MASEYDAVHRRAAESLASDMGMSMEQALAGIAFQHSAREIVDDLEHVLADASGDVWFDWSDGHGRLKIGVTTRIEASRIGEAERLLEQAGLADRADFVKVAWSEAELEAGQERALEALLPLLHRVSPGIDPSINSIVIEIADDLTRDELEVVEAAIKAAGVSIRVGTSFTPARAA